MSGYGFDASWTDEQRRLALLEQVYDPFSIATLEQLGVGSGWRCLDVGAGGGSIARWLRDRVGADGRVVAMDLDTRFFENEPGIEPRRADVLVDPLERGEFDLVHCRLLLHHLPGRQLDAVSRMVGALAPGGVLTATECYTDAILAGSSPLAAAWPGFEAAMLNADYGWAPGLPALLQAAGLSDVDATARADVIRGGSPAAEFLRLTLEAVRERISADVDVDAAANWLRDPRSLGPGVVWYVAWGRREPS